MDNFNSSDDQSSTESLPDWASSGQGNTTYDALIRAIDEIEDELDLDEDSRLNVESATQNLVNRVNESGGINERRPDGFNSDFERNIAERLDNSGIVLPPPSMPMPVAREISKRWMSDGESTLRHWRGSFWEHTGRHWSEMDDHDLKADLYRRLERATCTVIDRNGNSRPADWNPNRKRVGDLLEALAATQNTRASVEMPSWVDGTGDEHLIACQNVLVNPLTGQTREHTPAYFNSYSLGFDYDPDAECPQWNAFLETIWPGDQESKDLLQEWFGLVLSGDGKFEKMMFIIGPTRSGKGTIATVLTALLGSHNVAGPTLHSFTTEFGLQTLVGKPLAVVGDARCSKGTDIQQVTERVLTIVAGDQIDINRKHRGIWSGVLNTKIMMMSNQLLNWKDASGAITGRQLLLETKISFLGREDTGLKDRLSGEEELAGILNWAIQGYHRLLAAGRFTEPASTAETRQEMDEKANPLATFIDEKLVIDESMVTPIKQIFESYLQWARKTRETENTRSAETMFGGDLKVALGGKGIAYKRVRRTVGGKSGVWCYTGIGLADPLPDFAQ